MYVNTHMSHQIFNWIKSFIINNTCDITHHQQDNLIPEKLQVSKSMNDSISYQQDNLDSSKFVPISKDINGMIENILTDEEFITGRKAGIYINPIPLNGFKKIKCVRYDGKNPNPRARLCVNTTFVASVEIPVGSIIVMPLELRGSCDDDGPNGPSGSGYSQNYYVSDNLRTNQLKILKIYDLEQNEMESDCLSCSSLWNKNSNYNFIFKKNRIHYPNYLNSDLKDTGNDPIDGLQFHLRFPYEM